MDYQSEFEQWQRGYKRENDPLFISKVKEVRLHSGRSMQHCVWMLQICSGSVTTAVKLLNQIPPRVWC